MEIGLAVSRGHISGTKCKTRLIILRSLKNLKIIIPAIVKKATFAFDDQGFYSNDKTSIIPTGDLYLLGILNSKISDFVLRRIASTKQGGYFEQKPMYFLGFPSTK